MFIHTQRFIGYILFSFCLNGEPNNADGKEDCIELMPSNPVLNNWNDLPCSQKRKGFCEK